MKKNKALVFFIPYLKKNLLKYRTIGICRFQRRKESKMKVVTLVTLVLMSRGHRK